MLFDLRGRGRQRTVRVVYLGLALLMGGGLVLFGVGGSASGGLLDAFTGGSSNSGTDIYEQRIDDANRTLKANPTDQAALAALAKARFNQATQVGFDSTTQQFTAKGLDELRGADSAWQKYLATDPARPDDTLAATMAQAYAPTALNSPTRALQAWQVVTDVRAPEAGNFVVLAQYAYQAKNTRVADLASQRALELTPKAQRKTLKTTLDGYKAQAAGAAATAAGGATAPTATTG